MTLWLVRGGRYGEQEAMALRENAAIIGWDALGDMSAITDRSELTTLLATTYPDEGARTRSNWESQIWPFLRGFRASDLIVMPLKTRPSIMVGRIGPEGYRYRTDLPEDMRQTHAVSWRHELPRAAFDQDLLYSFGAFMTVCSVHRNDAESRVRAMLEGAPDPGMTGPRAGEEARAEQAVAEPAALDLAGC